MCTPAEPSTWVCPCLCFLWLVPLYQEPRWHWHSMACLFPTLSGKDLGQPCLCFWMVKCGFWGATGCSFGFPTGFQLWVELHRHWEPWSVSRSRAGSGFPKPRRAVPMAGAGPEPRESPSHLAGGLDQGLVLRHRVWHFALLWLTSGGLCLCHAVFPGASLHPEMPPLK